MTPASIQPLSTQPLTTRMLALIALFEGSQFGAINTWDEQYLSVGTLHYAVRQGSGYRFLARIQELNPAGFAACVGTPLARAVQAGPQPLTAFCRTYIWKKSGQWQAAFRNLSRLHAYAQADLECAQPYLRGGVTIARRYGLTSERGLTFAFDRAVQQGWGVRAGVDRAYRALPKGLPEFQVMKVLARAYAASANPKYRDVVLARSMTVALGSTEDTGYLGDFTLAQRFDLHPDRAWLGQL